MAPNRPDPVERLAASAAEPRFSATLRDTRAAAGSGKLVGLNIRLTPEMWKALKYAARVEDRPQAELVRGWIAPRLEEYARAAQAAGEM